MKVLVTGATGQLGFDVIRRLLDSEYEVIGTSNSETFSSVLSDVRIDKLPYYSLDITDEEAVHKLILEVNPDAIIHCAAWTAVDDAEENKKIVNEVNIQGTKYLAEAAKTIDAKFVYVSTDYVFDGTGETPWSADDKNLSPVSVYGESKLAGEKIVSSILEKYFIIRIAWVFGINGANFVKTMLRVGTNHDQITVVNDQIGTPTYTFDLARLLVDMLNSEKYGYYHATNEGGYISWFDFTKEIYRQAELSTIVNPVTTEEYGKTKANRPLNSRMDKGKLVKNGFEPLPDWRDALSRFLIELDGLEGENM